jgi:hypothetical protein
MDGMAEMWKAYIVYTSIIQAFKETNRQYHKRLLLLHKIIIIIIIIISFSPRVKYSDRATADSHRS